MDEKRKQKLFEAQIVAEIVSEHTPDGRQTSIITTITDESGRSIVREQGLEIGVSFQSLEQADAFAAQSHELFLSTFPLPLSHEIVLHFIDMLNRTAALMGIEDVDPKDLVSLHLKGTAERTRLLLEAPELGRYSQWDRLSLERAIRGVLRRLPRARWTIKNVAGEIQRVYGERAPASAEGLRKLINRIGLDWKELKRTTKTDSGQGTI